eukprot:SAG31_NODE_442_length_15661_cov_4.132245_17_plen_188_part_00
MVPAAKSRALVVIPTHRASRVAAQWSSMPRATLSRSGFRARAVLPTMTFPAFVWLFRGSGLKRVDVCMLLALNGSCIGSILYAARSYMTDEADAQFDLRVEVPSTVPAQIVWGLLLCVWLVGPVGVMVKKQISGHRKRTLATFGATLERQRPSNNGAIIESTLGRESMEVLPTHVASAVQHLDRAIA